ncbi:stage II sporulation protein M [Staphylococcus sp. Marseille-Q5304]|uniref:stage II sporulation protein M n=2 Tax=Staphylococcus TaxID=1279 RepID=UPI003365929C
MLVCLSKFFIGILIGVMLYYFSGINLGHMYLNNDLNFIDILLNNLLYFSISTFGFLTLGLANVFLLLLNGALIGFIFAHCFKTNQLLHACIYLVPHGILEICVLILTSTFSYYIILVGYNRFIKKDSAKSHIIKFFTFTIGVSIFLLIIAATIETYFKPL